MTVSTDNVSSRIFISYRREETAYHAGWLFDRLIARFGKDQVFKDVDSIELGEDFVERITTAVGSCVVLLALIGDRWLTVTDQDKRRLDNPNDYVRLEIEAALARGVRIIPILVSGARMPRADELPASMATLARRQALDLSPSRFDTDIQPLLSVLDRAITAAQGPTASSEQPDLPADSPSAPARSDTNEMVDRGVQAQDAGNVDEAERWFRRAAEAGSIDAMKWLAVLLYEKLDRVSEAEQWFRRIASAGDSYGMVNLGFLAVDRGDADKAGSWFLQAIDAGDSGGMFGLGVLLLTQEDDEEAKRWFLRAADAGNSDGMIGLGTLALDLEDADEAERWFRKAAKAGNADGMAGLGALARDRGDTNQAERWFRKAAKAGNADGMAGLGALAQDRGDLDEAERWFSPAAAAGNADGMAGLSALARDRGDTDQAEQWTGKAVAASDIDAADRLTGPYLVDLRSAALHPWEFDRDDAPDAIPIDPGYFDDS